jgi:hypothetical protein
VDDAETAAYGRLMGTRPEHNALSMLAIVLTGAAVVWAVRRWTDHDVSDPGVTL